MPDVIPSRLLRVTTRIWSRWLFVLSVLFYTPHIQHRHFVSFLCHSGDYTCWWQDTKMVMIGIRLPDWVCIFLNFNRFNSILSTIIVTISGGDLFFVSWLIFSDFSKCLVIADSIICQYLMTNLCKQNY